MRLKRGTIFLELHIRITLRNRAVVAFKINLWFIKRLVSKSDYLEQETGALAKGKLIRTMIRLASLETRMN